MIKLYLHHDAYNKVGKHLPSVDAQHKREEYPKSDFKHYCFYQHFIERDGTHIQTRPNFDGDVVYKEVHRDSISICLAGNFDLQLITREQILSLVKLFSKLITDYKIGILGVMRHSDYQQTNCPGRNFPAGYFRIIWIFARYKLSTDLLFRVLKFL